MTDKELINMIAVLWIESGGDADGFIYCYNKILERIKELKEWKEKSNEN